MRNDRRLNSNAHTLWRILGKPPKPLSMRKIESGTCQASLLQGYHTSFLLRGHCICWVQVVKGH